MGFLIHLSLCDIQWLKYLKSLPPKLHMYLIFKHMAVLQKPQIIDH
jgi:hypothetical protein